MTIPRRYCTDCGSQMHAEALRGDAGAELWRFHCRNDACAVVHVLYAPLATTTRARTTPTRKQGLWYKWRFHRRFTRHRPAARGSGISSLAGLMIL
jgi:hypothetical protein